MDIECIGLRDRRIAASDESISTQSDYRIYGRGSNARANGSQGASGFDRESGQIAAIILHQTGGNSYVGTRAARPLQDASRDSNVRAHSRLDRIIAHFVILNDGSMFYTHDVQYVLNDAGGRHGIDIEFAGRYPPYPSMRLSHRAIHAGRLLIRTLKVAIPSISRIHPHGQVQKEDLEGECGGWGSENVCVKIDSCPGPDIWVNVGMWAVRNLGLLCETTLDGYQNNGISRRQRDAEFDQHVQ